MAYIGNNTDHNAEVFKTTKDRFSGNASTTAFTLSAVPANAESMQVYVNNVRQDSGRAYTVSGTTLTFTEAPSSATGNIYVVFNSVIAGISQVITANTQLRTGVVTQHALSNTATYSVGELLVAGQITVSGGDTSAGDNAALGYTAAEGLILTGQGSTSDITLKNDADGTVFTGPTGSDDISFPDNAAILMGTGNDLKIFHNGSNSQINDLSTGNLQLLSNGAGVDIMKTDGEYMARFATDGAATLYYDNAIKLATTGSGGTLTGTWNVTTSFIPDAADGATLGSASYEWSDLYLADGATIQFGNDQDVVLTHVADTGLRFSDGDHLQFGASGDFQIFHDGSNTYLAEGGDGTGQVYLRGNSIELLNNSNETYAKFLTDGAVELYYDNSKKLETDTAGVNITGTLDLSSHLDMPDSAIIKLGASDDLQISHNGSYSLIADSGTGNLILACEDLAITNPAVGENMITAAVDGAVTLYHDNSAKLATTAGGVLVTGELESTTLDVNGAGDISGNLALGGTLTTAGITHIPNGTMAAPSLTFTNDTNTGITNNGALNNFYVSINGSMRIAVGSVIQFGCDGSAGTAALSFNGDWDTGIFHPTGDNLAITTAGTERMRFINSADVAIGTTSVSNDGPSTANSRLRVYRSGVCNGNIAHSTMGHFFASQSDDNTDGFEVYQQHGSNTTRNSFIVNDNRTGSKSYAFKVRGDGDVFGTDFVMQFPPSTPPAGTTTVYQNGALTTTDASAHNTPVPVALKVKKMYCYVNSTLSSGSAVVTLMKNGAAQSGTISVGTSGAAFNASPNIDFAVGDRIGIKIALTGASAAWYHVTVLCERN